MYCNFIVLETYCDSNTIGGVEIFLAALLMVHI